MGSMSGSAPEIPEDPNERELARIGGEEWQHYVRTGIPLENLYRQRIERMKSPAARERFIGSGVASVEGAAPNELEAGINPNSGAGVRSLVDRAVAKGKARSEAAVHGDQFAQDRYEQGRMSLIGIGRNQASEGVRGLSRVAAAGVQKNIGEANARMSERRARHGMYGQLAGMGLTAAYLQGRRPTAVAPESANYDYYSGGIPYREDWEDYL